MNNVTEFQNEDFGLITNLLIGTSLLLPPKSPAIPNFDSTQQLKNYIVNQMEKSRISGDIKTANFYDLLQSTILTESNWDPSAKSGIDKSGKRAWGLLQFRENTIKDINNRYGTNYTTKDALDMNKAIDMYEKYYNMLVKYHKYFKNKVNQRSDPNEQELSMMYNQGLTAWNKTNKNYNSAMSYWNKIKNNLKLYKSKLVASIKRPANIRKASFEDRLNKLI